MLSPAGRVEVVADVAVAAHTDEVTSCLDRAADVVDHALGTQWPRRIRVDLAGTPAAAAALVPPGAGRPPDAAAVAVTAPGSDGRIVVTPRVWEADQDARERCVLLTHELVHVAVAALWGVGQPFWLAEGYPDLVALDPVIASGVSRDQLVAPLRAVGACTMTIPVAARGDASRAYLAAWSLTDVVRRTWGDGAVLDLMAALAVRGAGDGGGMAPGSRGQDVVLQRRLGVDSEGLQQLWRADLAGVDGC